MKMNISKKLLLMHKEEVGFLPTDLAGLAIWLDVADLATLFTDSAKTTPVTGDGDVVGAWADKSGNGNDVLQNTTAKKPLYKVNVKNGLACLQFDGTASRMDKSGYATSQPHQIFAVTQLDASVVNDSVYRMIISNVTWPYFGINAGANPDKFSMYTGHWINGINTDSNWHCMIGHYDGVSSWIRSDGIEISAGDVGTAEWSAIDVGSISGGNYWKGYMAEILFFDPALSTDDMVLVEYYLINKWGIS
jgi:hypothetical protein